LVLAADDWRIVLERLRTVDYFAAMKTVMDFVRRWAEGEPFRPFTIRLEDGRAIPVTRLAHVACSDSGETLAVFLPDGSLEIIAQKSVSSLQEAPG
jgi:hypothetical protein